MNPWTDIIHSGFMSLIFKTDLCLRLYVFQGHANIAGRGAGGIDDGSRVHPGTVAGDVASKATVTISPSKKRSIHASCMGSERWNWKGD